MSGIFSPLPPLCNLPDTLTASMSCYHTSFSLTFPHPEYSAFSYIRPRRLGHHSFFLWPFSTHLFLRSFILWSTLFFPESHVFSPGSIPQSSFNYSFTAWYFSWLQQLLPSELVSPSSTVCSPIQGFSTNCPFTSLTGICCLGFVCWTAKMFVDISWYHCLYVFLSKVM